MGPSDDMVVGAGHQNPIGMCNQLRKLMEVHGIVGLGIETNLPRIDDDIAIARLPICTVIHDNSTERPSPKHTEQDFAQYQSLCDDGNDS